MLKVDIANNSPLCSIEFIAMLIKRHKFDSVLRLCPVKELPNSTGLEIHKPEKENPSAESEYRNLLEWVELGNVEE